MRPLLHLKLVLLTGSALIACGGLARADTDAALRRATAAFYLVYLDTKPAGVPALKVRAKLTPVISHPLAQLLERADAAERHYARATKKQAPPLLQGDLFTSLFEGAQRFSVGDCIRNTAASICNVELRYDEPGSRVTQWVDKVHLVRNNGRWVVDDIEFGGTWQFMRKARLKETLRKLILDGNHARP